MPWGCHDNAPHPGGTKQQKCFLWVLAARSPRSRCQQGQSLPGLGGEPTGSALAPGTASGPWHTAVPPQPAAIFAPPPLASCSSPSASSCWEPGFGFRAHPRPGGLHLRTLCLNKSHAGSGGPRGEPVFSGGRVQPPAVSIWYFHLLPWEASSTSPHRVGSIPVPPTWEGVQPKSPKTGHCRVTTHI